MAHRRIAVTLFYMNDVKHTITVKARNSFPLIRSLKSILRTKEPYRFIPKAFHSADNRDLAVF